MRKTFLSVLILSLSASSFSDSSIAQISNLTATADIVAVSIDKRAQYDVFVNSPKEIILEIFNAEADKNALGDAKADNSEYIESVKAVKEKSGKLSSVRVSVKLKKAASYDAFASGSSITLAFKDAKYPSTANNSGGQIKKAEQKTEMAAPLSKERKSDYTDILATLPKTPIDLDYSSVDIRDILDGLGLRAGINFVYGKDVGGNVSVHLAGVPFNEALYIILSLPVKPLSVQQIGSKALKVLTAQAVEEEKSGAAQTTRFFPLQYLEANEAGKLIGSMITAEGRKGKVNVDNQNNALVVTDIPSGLESVARILAQADRKPKQILIEAKLVEVSLKDGSSLGINWNIYGAKDGTMFGESGKTFIGSGSMTSQSAPAGYTPDGVKINYDGTDTVYLPIPNSATSGGTGINFPSIADEVSGAAFRFGRITNSFFFDATLSAAIENGKAKILSDPKVATVNNRTAKINIMTQIPYVTSITTASVVSQTETTVHYIDTGISLEVTPRVNADGKITMFVKPQVSQKSVASSLTVAQGSAPGVDVRSAETTVITQDGETIVIGGLIYENTADVKYKVPLLGDIPLLGVMFKKKAKTSQRIELLIFVTPRVMEN